MEVLYHCSPTAGLEVLQPSVTKYFGKPRQVCLTASVSMALFYGVKHFEYTYGYTREREIYYEEYFPGALEAIYRGRSASLYRCARRPPQAQPCRHGSLEKSAQGQEGQTDGGLGQHGLQERKDKGQLDPPLIGSGYGQDSFHQRDHASSPPFSAETRQAAAPSAARHSFS